MEPTLDVVDKEAMAKIGGRGRVGGGLGCIDGGASGRILTISYMCNHRGIQNKEKHEEKEEHERKKYKQKIYSWGHGCYYRS